MAETTGISWTDSTFNPWIGCQRVSPGCQHCYAETQDSRKRWGGETHWGPNAPRMRTSEGNWAKVRTWDRAAEKLQKRHLVFCSSLADVFEDRPELLAWRADLFRLIDETPHLTWLLLTKRPENIAAMAPERWIEQWKAGRLPANVWLGTTVEDQKHAEKRLPHLLGIPAAVHFVSAEPLLEAVDLQRWLWPTHWHWPSRFPTLQMAIDAGEAWQKPQSLVAAGRSFVDWVIVGGESGAGARTFDLQWARGLKQQCDVSHTAFFMKQKGVHVEEDGRPVGCIGKGDDVSVFPDDLRVQAFPLERAAR